MKVKVIRKFKDKYTDLWHAVGEKLTVSEERYKEIKRFVMLLNDESFKKVSSRKTNKADSQD